jgi:glucosamine 6-phosphate synthetase-like amidotransferase/phosphosugar isomerase protein
MNGAIRDRLADVTRALDLRTAVRRVGEEVPGQWAEALPAAQARGLRRLVISGCGDSLFAAAAARLAIERFGGIACEPLDALEAGRYASVRFSRDVGVLGISNSGATSRVVESIDLARAAGAVTMALCGTAASPLEQTAGAGVVRPVAGAGGRDGPTARVERHVGEYVGTVTALYHLAFHLGVARGVMIEPERRQEVAALEHAAALAQQALADGPERVTDALERLHDADRIFYLGAGPAYATALFGAAKVLEEVPLCGIPQHLEAWAHLQYFLTMEEGARTRAVIVAPQGDSTDRAAEIVQSIRDDGGVAVAVTHPAEVTVRTAASAAIVVDGDCWEGYAPVPYAVPMQLLGMALAMHHGRTVIPLGRRDGGRLIRSSVIRPPADA